MDLLRSLLSVPGQRQNMIDKALRSPADAVVLDLEDSVPPAMKDSARAMVVEALARPSPPGAPARFVRVNGFGSGRLDDDVRAVLTPGLAALVLPKVEYASELAHVDELVARLERDRLPRAAGVRLVVSVESARGLRNVNELADASARTVALLLGVEDFAADLGLPQERDRAAEPLAYARAGLVVAAASARLFSVDLVSLEFNDLAAYRARARASRQLGFSTAFCIHPAQIPVANEVFGPSDEEIAYARRVVAALDEAAAAGVGAIIVDGRFVERPIAERARRTLRLADAIARTRAMPIAETDLAR